jgi:hypothetical protein
MSAVKKLSCRVCLFKLVHDQVVDFLGFRRCITLRHEILEIRACLFFGLEGVVSFAFVERLFEDLAAHFTKYGVVE